MFIFFQGCAVVHTGYPGNHQSTSCVLITVCILNKGQSNFILFSWGKYYWKQNVFSMLWKTSGRLIYHFIDDSSGTFKLAQLASYSLVNLMFDIIIYQKIVLEITTEIKFKLSAYTRIHAIMWRDQETKIHKYYIIIIIFIWFVYSLHLDGFRHLYLIRWMMSMCNIKFTNDSLEDIARRMRHFSLQNRKSWFLSLHKLCFKCRTIFAAIIILSSQMQIQLFSFLESDWPLHWSHK